jgi:type II secretory pathway component PulM
MIERAIAAWRGASVRERRLLAATGLLVAAAAFFVLFVEPAWQGRVALARELPVLREQLAQMVALREELREIGQAPAAPDSAGGLRSRVPQLEASLRAAGLEPALRKLELQGELIELRFAAAPHEVWFGWLASLPGEMRLKVVDLSVSREGAPGLVSARVVLEAPRASR